MALATLAKLALADFWMLSGTFWICGWSTNGLIGTHFIPAATTTGCRDARRTCSP